MCPSPENPNENTAASSQPDPAPPLTAHGRAVQELMDAQKGSDPRATAGEAPEPLMRYFDFSHLRQPLQGISSRFHQLASELTSLLPRSAERTVAPRKLLESKDAAVRAAL